ncbi:MAG: hypothetical protein U1F68_14875 [Gammaproteobacteria bacterium]
MSANHTGEKTKPIRFEVSILLFQDQNIWVAHGIEWDIVAQGKTIAAAMEAFERTFIGQAVIDMNAGDSPLADIPEAPERIKKQFAAAIFKGQAKPFHLPKDVPPAYQLQEIIGKDWRIAS